jgi:hypothetical protein
MGLFSGISRAYRKAGPIGILSSELKPYGYSDREAHLLADSVIGNYWKKFELTLDNQARNTTDPIIAFIATVYSYDICRDDEELSTILDIGNTITEELLGMPQKIFLTDLDVKLLKESQRYSDQVYNDIDRTRYELSSGFFGSHKHLVDMLLRRFS